MNKNLPPKLANRRELLKKGALAGPVLLTLKAGPAWASAASLTCLERGVLIPKNGSLKNPSERLILYRGENDPKYKRYWRLVSDEAYKGNPGHSCAVSVLTRKGSVYKSIYE